MKSWTSNFILNPVLTDFPQRTIARIHIPVNVLKQARINAADLVLVSSGLPLAELEALSLQTGDKAATRNGKDKLVIGEAWPEFQADEQHISCTDWVANNIAVAQGGSISISRIRTEPVAAETVYLAFSSPESQFDSNTVVPAVVRAFVQEILGHLKVILPGYRIPLKLPNYHGDFEIVRIDSEEHTRTRLDGVNAKTTTTTAFRMSKSTKVIIEKNKSVSSSSRQVNHHPRDAAHLSQTSLADPRAYSVIGGLESQISEIRDLIETPLLNPSVYKHFGIQPPKGIILYGPSGTGKTLLARQIAQSTGCNLLSINGPELASAYHGETESRLRAIFDDARKNSPSIIVIDEFDALAPKRDDAGQVDKRVVATLLTLMDGIEDKQAWSSDDNDDGEEGVEHPSSHVIVIGVTNRVNDIDSALRRPGRFDRELEIGVPDAESRLKIFQVLTKATPLDMNEADLKSFADRTHGYVGADISSLIRNAALSALRRSLHSNNSKPESSEESRTVRKEDFEQAILKIRPSAMREVFVEAPGARWEEVGGNQTIKAKLKQVVEWPLKHPEAFARLGLQPPRGVLLYGPPGCSKTLIARAMATEAGVNFISIKGPELISKYVGESERALRELFRKARLASPCIIFMDEIDAIALSRDSGHSQTNQGVITTLLTEMDGVEPLKGVTIVSATNRPEALDTAILRPGRFDRLIYVGPPDEQARIEILQISTKGMALAGDVDFSILAKQSEGCSGAELKAAVSDAGYAALAEDLDAKFINQNHLLRSLEQIPRRITQESLDAYDNWSRMYNPAM